MHDSPIGPVDDVARRSCVRPLFRALKFLVGGVVFCAAGVFLVVAAVVGFIKGEIGLPLGLAAAAGILILIGVCAFRSGGYLWRVAFDPRWYFRVGPGGLSACIPDEQSLSSYTALQVHVPWDDIVVMNIHGWETDPRAFGAPAPFNFETRNGGKTVIETYYFAENTLQIVKNILAVLGEEAELPKALKKESPTGCAARATSRAPIH